MTQTRTPARRFKALVVKFLTFPDPPCSHSLSSISPLLPAYLSGFAALGCTANLSRTHALTKDGLLGCDVTVVYSA